MNIMQPLDAALASLFSEALSDLSPGSGRAEICTPDDPGDCALGLYLYSVRPCLDIQSPPFASKGSAFRERAPQFLTLSYLMTAYSRAEGTHKTLEEHRILSRAAETLLRFPALTERELGFRPGSYIDRLQIRMLELSPEEMSNIWVFHEKPYKLSIGFEILPIEILPAAGSPVIRVSEASTHYEGKSDHSVH